MKINSHIFRGYDVRGIVDKDLNPEIVECIGKAYGTFLLKRDIKDVVVGRDCRLSSEPYSKAIIRGILSTGVNVVDIGLALVGTTYWAQYYFQAKGCVSVSGSHNPTEYNGFKLGTGFSHTMVSEEIQELKKLTENEAFFTGNGTLKEEDVKEFYFQDLIKRFPSPINLKVVIDPGYSTAGAFVPELLEKMGCDVVRENCTIDGSFPLGAPDPTEKKVAQRISAKVKETEADIGISYDSDGDRIGVVDNQGGILWNDVLVGLFALNALEGNPGGKIVFNALCSKLVDDLVKEKEGVPIMWQTGHSFIKEKAQKEKALFAGELSGHFYFLDKFYPHDDGCYSSLEILSYLSKEKRKLSEVIENFPKYISSPEIKIGCKDDEIKMILMKNIEERLKQSFSKENIINDERVGDGVRVEHEEKMFIIRYSQNAPYLTIKFEAKEKEDYDNLKKYIKELLLDYEDLDWDSKINVNIDALS
jgi:phosphomannomutase / phosphoglucomutase